MNEAFLHALAEAEREAIEGADILVEDDFFLPPLDHQGRHGANLFESE